MRYAALITLRALDGLHWAGCEAVYLFGGRYWALRRVLVRYLSRSP